MKIPALKLPKIRSRIDEAFAKVDRSQFLPERVRDIADLDAPIAIGYGQTNSQPSTVRLMLRWLDPQSGDRALDVGSGSGWTTALLAHLVGPEGTVYAVDRIPELVRFGSENNRRAGIGNVEFFEAGDTYGLPEFAPYQRILVSAMSDHVPRALLDQLAIGGKLVMPIKSSVHVVERIGDNAFNTEAHPGFVFVPLVKGAW